MQPHHLLFGSSHLVSGEPLIYWTVKLQANAQTMDADVEFIYIWHDTVL